MSVRDVVKSQLMAYDPEKELLPLVIASRHYTLLQGRETEEQYEWETLQSQIEERFIRNKPRIEHQPRDIDTVVYREDFTNAKVFEALQARIPQEPLRQAVIDDISKDYRDITDVVQSLSMLDITIGYLVSVGTDGDMMLKEYMEKMLTLKKKLCSEQVCFYRQLSLHLLPRVCWYLCTTVATFIL